MKEREYNIAKAYLERKSNWVCVDDVGIQFGR